MWTWSVLIASIVVNLSVLCVSTNFDYEAAVEKVRHKFAMDSFKMKPYVYRRRFPRRVYNSEPSTDELSLKTQERFPMNDSPFQAQLNVQERVPRSDSLLQPQLIHFDELELPHVHEATSVGIQNRLEKRRQLRRVLKNDAELQILDMDPLQLKEALILGLRSLAKRQAYDYSAMSNLFYEDVPADLPETSLYSDNIYEEKLSKSSENTQTELEKPEDEFIGVLEDETNDPLNTDDKMKDKLIEESSSILNKQSEIPLITTENYESEHTEGPKMLLTELSNPSYYNNYKHEDKFIESSEILTSELAKTSDNTNGNHEAKLIDSSDNHEGPSVSELLTDPVNKKGEENIDKANAKDIVNVYQEKSDLDPREYKSQAHPKRHVKLEFNQDSFYEPPILDLKTLSKGRNLEISNFLTPDKSTIYSIDKQSSFDTAEESKITNISKGEYISEEKRFVDEDSIVYEEPEKSNRIVDDDSVNHKASEKPSQDEVLFDSVTKSTKLQDSNDDDLIEDKNKENSKEDEYQNDKNIAKSITDYPTETNYSSEDDAKYKHGESPKSKDQDNKDKNKETKDTEYSNDSKESSSESAESDEKVNKVKMKPLPQCPDFMDVSYRVDKYKGVACSTDDDCKEEGEFCCQAYSNLNKCSSNLSSKAMDVTQSE